MVQLLMHEHKHSNTTQLGLRQRETGWGGILVRGVCVIEVR